MFSSCFWIICLTLLAYVGIVFFWNLVFLKWGLISDSFNLTSIILERFWSSVFDILSSILLSLASSNRTALSVFACQTTFLFYFSKAHNFLLQKPHGANICLYTCSVTFHGILQAPVFNIHFCILFIFKFCFNNYLSLFESSTNKILLHWQPVVWAQYIVSNSSIFYLIYLQFVVKFVL